MSSTKSNDNWEKPFGMRAWELSQALLIVRDALKAVERGELHHVLTIAGQLRSLLCERTRGNSLLFSVANVLGITPQIWAPQEVGMPPFVQIAILGGPFSCFRFQQNQRLVDLEQLLEETVVFTTNEFQLSFHNFIKFYADKMGGAHYDHSMSLEVAKLLQLERMTGIQIVSPLLNLASVIVELGAQILGQVFDFRIDVSASLPLGIQDDKITLFHGVMPNTRTEFELFLNAAGAVGFYGKSIDSRFASLCGSGPKELSEPFWVSVKHRISCGLKSHLSIFVNGKSVDENESDILAISGEMYSYNRVFGGNVACEASRKSPICLNGVWVAGQHPLDADREMNEYVSARGKSCILLKSDSVFRFEKGDGTGKADGEAIHLNDYRTALQYFD